MTSCGRVADDESSRLRPRSRPILVTSAMTVWRTYNKITGYEVDEGHRSLAACWQRGDRLVPIGAVFARLLRGQSIHDPTSAGGTIRPV
jgi:hypothetical protein